MKNLTRFFKQNRNENFVHLFFFIIEIHNDFLSNKIPSLI